MRILIFGLTVLLTANLAHALINNDKVYNTKLLKVQDDNIVVLSRGVEDGIEVGDHAKIINERGFIARSICVRAGMITSHWKIYRVVYPEKVSKDDNYTIIAINNSQIPEKYAEYKEDNYPEDYADFTESELLAWGERPAETTTSYDLPDNLSDDPILDEQKDFYARNFDGDQFMQDFQAWAISVGVNPFTLEVNRGNSRMESTNYTAQVNNQGKKYVATMYLSNNVTNSETKDVDFDGNLTDIKSKQDRQMLEFSFDIRNVIPRVGLISRAYIENSVTESPNSTTTYSNINITPIGVGFSVIKSDDFDDYSQDVWRLTLTPGYNKQVNKSVYLTEDFFNPGAYQEQTDLQEFRTITLTVGSEINFNIGALTVMNNSTWGPNIDPKEPTSFDTRNVKVTNNLEISYPFSGSFNTSVSYLYEYNANKGYGPLGQKKTQHIYTVNLNYTHSFL